MVLVFILDEIVFLQLVLDCGSVDPSDPAREPASTSESLKPLLTGLEGRGEKVP
jgi:hypothetical protein